MAGLLTVYTCCAIVVPLICISESSVAGWVGEDQKKDEVGWEKELEVPHVVKDEREEDAGPRGVATEELHRQWFCFGQARRTTADENKQLQLNSLA